MKQKEIVNKLKNQFGMGAEDYYKWLIARAAEAEQLENKVKGLEDSLRIYKEESDIYEQSTHIDNFMYEMNVNEKGEIPCLIKANGIEHSIGITERDAKSFVHIFQMVKMK